MNHRFALALGAAAVIAGSLGCGKPSGTTGDSAGACPAKSSVSIAISAVPNTLDWSASHESSARNYPVMLSIMRGLTALDAQHRPVPALAESWEIKTLPGTPQRQVYTFHLRKDVVWSDGKTPLVAADFVFGWRRALLGADSAELGDLLGADEVRRVRELPGSGAEKADQLTRALSQVGVKAPDTSTLEVTLASPRSYFLARVAYVYAFFPAPSADLQGKGEPEIVRYFNEPAQGKPMVLGAFKLQKWDRAGHEVELVENPHDRLAPSAGRVSSLKIAEATLGPLAYDQCQVDFLFMDDPAARAAGKGPPADMQSAKLLSTYWLGLNTTKLALPLRRAIARALDRKALFEPLAPQLPGLRVAQTFLPPEMPGALPEGHPLRAQLPTFDKEAAKKDAAEAGYKGEELTLLVQGGATFMPEPAIADGLRRQLEAVGIRVKIVTTANFTNDVKDADGTLRHHLILKRTGADFAHPHTLFVVLQRDGNHYTDWHKVDGGAPIGEFEKLLAEGAAEADLAKAAEIYGRAEVLVEAKQVAIVPLFHPNRYYRKRPWIQGLGVDPFNVLTLQGMRVARPGGAK
jgi:peptide/nickel transport system substrate-binding protein